MIEYKIKEQVLDLTPKVTEVNPDEKIIHFEDGVGVYKEDTLDKEVENAVHQVFPFSSAQDEIYRCPNWAK